MTCHNDTTMNFSMSFFWEGGGLIISFAEPGGLSTPDLDNGSYCLEKKIHWVIQVPVYTKVRLAQ